MKSTRSVFCMAAVLAAVSAASCASAATSAATPTPLPVDEVLSMQEFVRFSAPVPALSPDGKRVAYVVRPAPAPSSVRDPEERSSSTGMPASIDRGVIFVADTSGGTPIAVTAPEHSATIPVWSPDSRKLAFYSDAGGYAAVWVWDLATGKSAIVAPVRAAPINEASLFWMPDGTQIVARLVSEGGASDRKSEGVSSGSTVRVFTARAQTLANAERGFTPHDEARRFFSADIALLSLSDGSVRRVARGVGARNLRLSPDGSRVAFTVPVGFSGQVVYRAMWDLVVVYLQTGESKVVAPQLRLSTIGRGVAWSPDSRWLGWVTTETRQMQSRDASDREADGQAYVVAADGSGPARRIADEEHPDLGGVYRGAAWSSDGDALYAATPSAVWEVSMSRRRARQVGSIPGKTLVAVITSDLGARIWSPGRTGDLVVLTRDTDTKSNGLYVIDIASGASRRIWEGPMKLGGANNVVDCDPAAMASVVVCMTESFQTPSDLWAFRADGRSARRVTDINPRLSARQLGSSRLLRWRDFDGNTMGGVMLLPPGYVAGRRYPLLVVSYPGRNYSGELHAFAGHTVVDLMQLLTTRGYVVLCADVYLRGSPMRDIASSVLPGIDTVVEQGIADPLRIGVMGESGGGYNVLALITQSTRFKAAVEMTGFADLMGLYGSFREPSSHWAVGWLERASFVGASPWQRQDLYIDNSPIYRLDRVQTPLLMLHGSLDNTVHPQLAGQIFVGLRRLGKEVVYAQYEGEDHGIDQLDNRRDLLNRVIDWFDGHLSEAPAD